MNYDMLRGILDEAYEQATGGKGQERHAAGRDFDKQPIISIPTLLGDDEGTALLFQAIKKLEESLRLPPHMKRNERLGAINYIAASMLLPACQSDREEPAFLEHVRKSTGGVKPAVRQCPQCMREEGTGHKMDCTHITNDNQTMTMPAEARELLENGVDIVDEHGIIPPGVAPDSADGGVRARVANMAHMTRERWIEQGGDGEEWDVHRDTRNLHVQEGEEAGGC